MATGLRYFALSQGQSQSQACTPVLVRPEAAKFIYPTSMLHKNESNRSMYCKFRWKIRNVNPKGSETWQHPSIFPSFHTCSTIEVSTPTEKRGAQFDLFQPGTKVKFVEPNAIAIGWRNVAVTSNTSNNNCATMLCCSLYRQEGSPELSIDDVIPSVQAFQLCEAGADNCPPQPSEMSVETVQMSIVHNAMPASEPCHR